MPDDLTSLLLDIVFLKDRIAKSVFWVGWAKGTLQLVAFACTVLVARLLAPEDFGLIALTGMWIGVITLLADMGLSAAIDRKSVV